MRAHAGNPEDSLVQAHSGNTIEQAIVAEFQRSLYGELIVPEDEAYHKARAVWNGMIDKYPAIIAKCANVADVIASVRFARDNNMLVAVRGGGHNVAGFSTCDGGLVIDLSRMRGVRIDPARRSARAQGGSIWRDVDHATSAFGLATPGGVISHTGVGGLTLGGGIGYLSRTHGYTCDNLISADVVTAAGEFLVASESENTDLFWGLRGGGGNFGIVTEFEYRLHPVTEVLVGAIIYPVGQAVDVLRRFRDLAANAPDELFAYVALGTGGEPFPQSLHGEPYVALVLFWAGSVDKGEQFFAPIRSAGKPSLDHGGLIRYADLQCRDDNLLASQAGLQNYWKAEYLKGLSDQAIEVIVEKCQRFPSSLSYVAINHLGGAIGHRDENDMAISHRDADYLISVVGLSTDPLDNDANIAWARDFWTAMQPHSSGGAYVNYVLDEGQTRVHEIYGEAKYERLGELKKKFDPTNLFSLNQNILPQPDDTGVKR